MLTELGADERQSAEVEPEALPSDMSASGALWSVVVGPDMKDVARAEDSATGWPRPLAGVASSVGSMATHAGVLLRRSRMLLLDPHGDTFALLGATARWRDSVGVLATAGALSGLLYSLQRPITGTRATTLVLSALGGGLAMLVFGLAGAALLGWLAAMLGGQGSMRTSSYLLALACGPLLVLGIAARPLPAVGTLAGTAVSLYGFVLAVLAARTAYRLSYVRALFVVFAGMLIFTAVLLIALAAFLFLALKAAFAG